MNIVFKNSLKNIFGKPLRTLLVVFAIFVCSLCALLCFDLSESITGILTLFYGSVSRADAVLSTKYGISYRSAEAAIISAVSESAPHMTAISLYL